MSLFLVSRVPRSAGLDHLLGQASRRCQPVHWSDSKLWQEHPHSQGSTAIKLTMCDTCFAAALSNWLSARNAMLSDSAYLHMRSAWEAIVS